MRYKKSKRRTKDGKRTSKKKDLELQRVPGVTGQLRPIINFEMYVRPTSNMLPLKTTMTREDAGQRFTSINSAAFRTPISFIKGHNT